MKVPTWLSRAVIIAIITVIVTVVAGWGQTLSSQADNHEVRISKIETHITDRDKSIDEELTDLKNGQKEQHEDLKEILRVVRRRQQ